jgi:ABC-type glycerol-3-phosphate transport system permease component
MTVGTPYSVSLSDRERRDSSLRQTQQGVPAFLAYLLVGIGSAFFLLPLFWMISSSLKPNYQVLEVPPRWLPNPFQWSNYVEALTYVPFGRFAVNTFVIAALTIVGHIVSCTVVAYGFARLQAPGKEALFVVLLATMMLPYPVTMIPIYVGFKSIGWINTFLPLIVPAFFGNPFYIFLLRQFFLTIPPDLEEAARIDGANTLQTIWHVILPLVGPAIATVAIFTFQEAWRDFLPPLIYLHDQTKYTVSLGLSFFRSSYDIRWNYLMAASLVTMLPVVVVFFVAQKSFIEGITLTGIKG